MRPRGILQQFLKVLERRRGLVFREIDAALDVLAPARFDQICRLGPRKELAGHLELSRLDVKLGQAQPHERGGGMRFEICERDLGFASPAQRVQALGLPDDRGLMQGRGAVGAHLLVERFRVIPASQRGKGLGFPKAFLLILRELEPRESPDGIARLQHRMGEIAFRALAERIVEGGA